MFLENTLKCLKLFDEVYVSSDDELILRYASSVGAIPIRRGEDLCGDTPNITVYQHTMELLFDDVDGIVAVQANSPTIALSTIRFAKELMESGVNEVMTCHKDYSIYGSVWGVTRERLLKYKDPYKPTPEVLIVDNSVDIHTQADLNRALKQITPA